MTLLKLLRALLGLANTLASYLQERQLIEAGEAKAIAEGYKNAEDAIMRAKAARTDSNTKFNDSDGVPDEDDPNLRD